jgi:metal-responsive CopG/Arc/MetJ family transcriptional regulator
MEVAMQKTKVTKERNQKSTRTTVNLPSEDYEELERIAVRNKVSVAWVIREAVSRYLAEQAPLFRQR